MRRQTAVFRRNFLGLPQRHYDTTCATVHVKEPYTAEGILQAPQDNGCDLIVMASHGRRGLARLILGSQALRALTYSKVPVLICR